LFSYCSLRLQLKRVREKMKLPCEMCRNYEMQLQSVQNNEVELTRQLAHSQELLKSFKDDLKKEQAHRCDLEEKFNEESKQADEAIKELCNRMEECQTSVETVKVNMNDFCRDANEQLTHLMKQNDELARELDRLHRENDTLLGRHIAKSRTLQTEAIDLPQDLDEMQFYCLKLREELITTLTSKEAIEDALKGENLFLKEQLRGEQQLKESIEESLTVENDTLRVSVDTQQSQLNELKAQHEEQQHSLIECSDKLDKLTTESQQKISELQVKVDELTNTKVSSFSLIILSH
jgi:chromosome segregation ATPase